MDSRIRRQGIGSRVLVVAILVATVLAGQPAQAGIDESLAVIEARSQPAVLPLPAEASEQDLQVPGGDAQVSGDGLASAESGDQSVEAVTPQQEADCLALLAKYPSEQDAARIYRTLERIYFRKVAQHPEKVAEYCQRALACPQDLLTRIKLHADWGTALMPRGSAAGPSAQAKAQAVAKWLAALNLVAASQTAQMAQSVPAVRPLMCRTSPQDSQYQARRQQHEQQVAAREAVLTQNRLLAWRHALVEICAESLAHEPDGRQMLHQLAADSAASANLTQELLAAFDRIGAR